MSNLGGVLGALAGMRIRFVTVLLATVVAVAIPATRGAMRADAAVTTHGYMALVGSMHDHSGYSDGYPGSTPATYYASAKHFGLDFLASSEHSDTTMVPLVASDYCLSAEIVSCIGGDPEHPENALQKWVATLRYAQEATTSTFLGLRGFEWTSDRFGHINVYFSHYDSNAKLEGGYVTMEAFWQWFLRPVKTRGGQDGLATFNHPGDKKLIDGDAAFNWNDFAYKPAADDRMVGIELYNTRAEYGAYYVRALDKGWHLGAVGAEDLGHKKGDDWGGPSWAKTVILATDRSEAAIRAAMLSRRFYAVADGTLRLDFTVDGSVMGSRLVRAPGSPLAVHAEVTRPSAVVELMTSGGQVVASGSGGVLDHALLSAANQRYYFVRVRDAGVPVAYSSPIWIQTP